MFYNDVHQLFPLFCISGSVHVVEETGCVSDGNDVLYCVSVCVLRE